MMAIFWISALLIGYTYVGYPVLVWFRQLLHARAIKRKDAFLAVSVVMAVRNESDLLPRKLNNLFELRYPGDCEIVVACDGSDEGIHRILARQTDRRLKVVISKQQEGKACALNRAIKVARGEILIFTDVRQIIEADAIVHLAQDFADATVGCVSGELLFGSPLRKGPVNGHGLYWAIEKKIRQWESASDSMTGATGALYAVRRRLVVSLPPSTILDDVLIPLEVARQGARVVFECDARVWDDLNPTLRQEFHRKVRTLTGNYQLLQLAPWVLTRQNPVRFQFVSHKLMRLFTPFALIGVLISALCLDGSFYQLTFGLQVILYGLAPLALYPRRLGWLSRLASVALTFVMLNTAAVSALVNFITGKKEVWVR